MVTSDQPLARRPFGRTGLDVSALGFGAAPAAFLRSERDGAAKLVHALLDAGVNLLDTALMYPGSEEFIGEYFADRRDDYVLVTKCGQKNKDLPGGEWSAENVSAAVDRALKLLRTDRLDVMFLHSCDLPTLRDGEALGALVKARDAGKILHAGYSGDNDVAAFAATLADVAVIETSVNVVDQHNIDAVLPPCVENGVGVIAKRPIANAAWKDLDQQAGMYKNYAKTYTERLAAMGFKPSDVGMSDADWPELALRFTLAQPGISTAIIGTTSRKNAEANLAAARKGPLEAEKVAVIRQVYAAAPGSDGWTGQT